MISLEVLAAIEEVLAAITALLADSAKRCGSSSRRKLRENIKSLTRKDQEKHTVCNLN